MRKSPSADAYKVLYARSGNVCAFPDCDHPIFNDYGLYIAELCHIKAANKGGPRYDPEQSEEERRSPENLLFMCRRHHKETDEFTAERLYEIKKNHEARFMEYGGRLTDDMVDQIEEESRLYWKRQREKEFELSDLKMETDFDLSESELFEDLIQGIEKFRDYGEICAHSDSNEKLAEDLKELFEKAGLDYSKVEQIPYYENPFMNRNWEYHYIGVPNFLSILYLKLFQLRVRTFENLVKLNPEDQGLKVKLSQYRKEFELLYDKVIYVD